MATLIASLRHLQTIEQQIAQVRRRLKSRKNAEALQQRRIDQLQADWQALHDRSMDRRKEADSLSLDLKQKEEQVGKLRNSLNTARTNKEYAAILTQINTFKADNAKFEDQALKVMQEVEVVNAEAAGVQSEIETETQKLETIRQNNQGEVDRLNGMIDKLQRERDAAVVGIDAEALSIFERISGTYEGEAMAEIEVHGRRPPFNYVCGGCYMSLNAEHANALRTRDEIRTCDNCGRILFLPETQTSNA